MNRIPWIVIGVMLGIIVLYALISLSQGQLNSFGDVVLGVIPESLAGGS